MTSDRWIWEPSQEQIQRTNVFRMMKRLGIGTREEFLRFSQENLETFWDLMVKEVGVEWFTPYRQVLDTSEGVEWSRWFVDGKVNIAWNCLDRHLRDETAHKAAIVWEGEDGEPRTLSFRQLAEETNRLANALKQLGLEREDRVALCMPMVPEVVAVLYACFKLGLIAVPVFSGFGAGAIGMRLQDSGARVVFTADFGYRRGKLIPLKEKIDEALQNVPGVKKVVVLRYRGGTVPWNDQRDSKWEDFAGGQSTECASSPLDSETKALILYTSGTTGKPKGTVHTHGGCLAQMTKEIYLGFDHQAEDRFFWLSDIGWMMGAWEIIGNHHFGGTIFLFDGAPDYPNADRLWQILERHRITTFGVSPTVIRLLMRQGSESPQGYDLSSLRLLGSTGEPWDETSYLWFFENIGRRRCPIINISGGTEIVGCFLFPLPIEPMKLCSLGGPAPGMATEVFDETGRPVRGRKGYLVCTKPAPSMTRGIWGDPQRYLENYWSRWKGVWYHGDWASVDEDGCWFLHGRADEAMNIAGRKVGPGEVEDALTEHAAVSEAAAIGVPDDVTGEALVVFVVLKLADPETESLAQQISTHLTKILGPTFKPRAVHVVKELPKTQSGKIIRRLIRQKYLGEPLGDLSTVENPHALQGLNRQS